MEVAQPTHTVADALTQLASNIVSPHQLLMLRQALLELPDEEDQIETQPEEHPKSEVQAESSHAPAALPAPSQIAEAEQPANQPASVEPQPHLQVPPPQEVQLPQPPSPSQDPKPEPKRDPLHEPPLIAARRNATEQSSEPSRANQPESRKGRRHSSEEESLNLELTQKTKRSKNMSFTQNKVDSLLYSDATLLYSNDTTGLDRPEPASHLTHLPHRTESQKVVLKKVEDEGEDISARMERAESRQCDRMPTESQRASETRGQERLETQAEDGGVFQTQINEYKGKISKIRELKENKKRKLEAELRRVNEELEDLTKREQEAAGPPKPNNFESRVKIQDNVEAKVKAERFVRNLHQDKRSRQEVQLGELQVIDKNINDYMEELMRERYKNEERIKQRKKLEIIDRMKQQEVRKIEEQRQKDKNREFLQQLRGSASKPDLQQPQPEPHPKQPQGRSDLSAAPSKNKDRSPTKKSEPTVEEETPELSRKKAYLRKIRNLSFKKEKADAYEQLLA